MFYVLLSICCSVIVSILLKLARRYHIDIYQAITWNYSSALALSWVLFRPRLGHFTGAPFGILGILGIMLPLLFVILAVSVRAAGIVRTDVAQRLSLFIPIIAAFLLFHEQLTTFKFIGIGIGFAAILCSIPWQKGGSKLASSGSWLYLLIVFFGMGVIDVLFKQLALVKSIPFTTSLFLIYIIAFLISLIGLLYLVTARKSSIRLPHVLFGWLLGAANFGNIYFYLKAHQALVHNPSTVFSAMNIGVIVLGAMVGLLIFKEKLSMLNKAGIGLAILSIVIISFF